MNSDLSLVIITSYFVCFLLNYAYAEVYCNIMKVNQCKNANEMCSQLNGSNPELGICTCRPDYEYVDNICVPKSIASTLPPETFRPTEPYGSEGMSGTWWILIPCLSLAVMGALVLLGKKYRLTERLYALRVRRYNTVFVSSANVDDDAPIT